MSSSNTFVTVKVKADFVHPSGMHYKAGTGLKLTPVGVKAWLAEGWINDPAVTDAPAPAPEAAAPDVPTAGG